VQTRTTSIDWPGAGGLSSAATRGGMRAAATSWVRFVLQFSALLLLARLLGPSQYGAAAAALVAVAAAELLRAGGVGWLVSRSSDATPALVTTLHLSCSAVGLVLAAGLLAAGVALPADRLPGGALTFPLLGIVALAAGLGAVPTALLVRNLRAGTVAVAELAAAALSVTVALVSAAAGAGALALLLQAACYAATLCTLVLALAPWRPSRPAPLRDIAPHLPFIGNATLTQGLDWAVRSLDRLVVALLFGPAAAGVYTQAAQLVILPVEQVHGPLRRIAVPSLGRLLGDPERYRAAYRSIVTVAAGVLWPALAVLAVLADDVVHLAFGPAWHETAHLYRVMLPAALALVVTGVTAMVTLAAGIAGRQAVWECAISRPATVLAFVAGSQGGVLDVAACTSVAAALLVVPGHAFVARRAGLTVRDLLGSLAAPGVVALTSAGAAFLVRWAWGGGVLGGLLLAGLAAAAVAVGTALALAPTRRVALRAFGHLHGRSAASGATAS